MKIEFLALGALAASAAAVPIRIITLTGPMPHLPPSEVSHSIHTGEYHHGHMIAHPHPPCHGKSRAGGFNDLLTRLGFVRPHPEHGHGNEHDQSHEPIVMHHGHVQVNGQEREWRVIKAWKHRVEEVADQVVPIMEGGMVRILPFTEDDRVRMEQEQAHGSHGDKHHPHSHTHGHGGEGRHHLRPHGGHHWHRSSFAGRLHRAISSLSPTEATILAFVLGAGIGSIMHLIFMLFLITIRRMRGLKSRTKEQRKEARKARRAARVAKVDQAVVARLDGEKFKEVEGEVLPGYGEGEGDRLVEKA